jgi:YbbR domain-containing protein
MKNLIAKNIWLKIVSLIIAVTLWFFVILSGRSEIDMDVPVTVTNVPERFEVTDYPKTINVGIEGQERLLKYLKPNEIIAVLDISDAKVGRTFYTLSKDNIKLPTSFLVTSINPETVSVKIESQLKKIVNINPHIVGKPEKGFVIVSIKADPESVTLEGPRSMITTIDTIKTEPIDINGINSSLIYKANLNLSSPNIKKSVNKVDVNISVEKISKEKP